MKNWRCDFCEREAGPNKAPRTVCKSCSRGNMFILKNKMHPIDAIDWKRHRDLDDFINSLDINILESQRELLHEYCVNSRPGYVVCPMYHGRTFYRTGAMAVMEILMQGKKQKEV